MKRTICLTAILAAVAGSAVVASTVTLNPPVPVAGGSVEITYVPGECDWLYGETEVWLRYGFNDWSPTKADVLVTSNGAPYVVTVPVPAPATEINIAFRNADDPQVFDNNNGQNWNFHVDSSGFVDSVTLAPPEPSADSTVTVTYDPTDRPLEGE